jgi:menaquinone-dependent protoporphyrinogen oxidase
METKVLVAYASVHGSTREIAEKIAATMREGGLEVDLQPIREARKLDGYRAVVLGAPLYMFHWHKDALRFLSQHRRAIEGGLQVAIFGGGPIEESDEKGWLEVRAQMEKELAKFPWLAPLAVEIVGGKFDPTRLRFPYNLIPAMKQMAPSDLRDWAAIQAWARDLAVKLQPVLA